MSPAKEKRKKEKTKEEEHPRHLENRLRELETENQLLSAKCLRLEWGLNYLRDRISQVIESQVRDSPLDADSIFGLYDLSNNILISKEITYIPEYDFLFKIILFGDSGVNRTGLTQNGVRNVSDSESGMSIGVEWEEKTLKVDDQIVKLKIWDVGGEERYRSIIPYYARGARGGLFVCDMSNYSSLAHIDDWLTVIWKEVKVNDRFPVVVVGLVPNDENKREVSTEEAIKIAESRGANGYIECNVKTGENIHEAFVSLSRLMLHDSS